MNPITITMLAVGGVLVWCGITNRNPIEVTKSVLTNGSVPAAGTGTPSASTYMGSADSLERQAANAAAAAAQAAAVARAQATQGYYPNRTGGTV